MQTPPSYDRMRCAPGSCRNPCLPRGLCFLDDAAEQADVAVNNELWRKLAAFQKWEKILHVSYVIFSVAVAGKQNGKLQFSAQFQYFHGITVPVGSVSAGH